MTIDRRVVRTRTALYDALVALIRTQSYDGITVEQILARANVGRSTFYAHFTSKDDLLERSLERLAALLDAALATGDDALDPCRALFEHVADYRDVQLALASGRGGAILREAVDGVLVRALRKSIGPELPDGIPADLVVSHIVGTFHTVLGWWLANQPDMCAAQADELFRRLVTEGLPPTALGAFALSGAD